MLGIEAWVFWVATAACLYMAWNIGANDVANAMGTSVGSGALTIRQAVLVAGVLEFCGAFFVGGHVTDTVRKGILDSAAFVGHEDLLMYGMLAALADEQRHLGMYLGRLAAHDSHLGEVPLSDYLWRHMPGLREE